MHCNASYNWGRKLKLSSSIVYKEEQRTKGEKNTHQLFLPLSFIACMSKNMKILVSQHQANWIIKPYGEQYNLLSWLLKK